jgi:hypothetical protein
MEYLIFGSSYNNMDNIPLYDGFGYSDDHIYQKEILYNENKPESHCKNNNTNEKMNELKTKPTTNDLKNENSEKISYNEAVGTNLTIIKKKRGRPGTTGNHNKFSDDNIRTKCKHLILKSVLEFINKKIEEKYNGNIGQGIFIKKLLVINQKQKSDASIQFNKDFLDKTLGDIFSENISSRYTTYPPNHNNILIKELLNDKDESKNTYFKKLFSLTFSDCLKHFRGSQIKEELEGLKGFDNINSEFENDEDYLKIIKYYIMNYEDIIRNKRARKIKKNSL